MKIYCVIERGVYDGDDWFSIDTFQDRASAQSLLKRKRDDYYDDWADEDVERDEPDCFSAYRDGEYSLYHIEISVEETELL